MNRKLIFGPAQLVDVVQQMPTLGEEAVLFARPPLTWASDAILAELTEDYRVSADIAAAGYQYLLGQEELNTVLTAVAQKVVSPKTTAELVLHYAVLDAWPAWFDDLRDR